MENKMYHTEDIELLLLQKEFHELLPEEKAFILTHIEDESEYNRMRNLLLQMIELESDDLPEGPDERVKQNLDALFKDQNKARPLWQTISFWSISGIAALFILGFFFLYPPSAENEKLAFAENHINAKDTLKKEVGIEGNTNQNTNNGANTVMPYITPEVITEDISTTTDSDREIPISSSPSDETDSNPIAAADAAIPSQNSKDMESVTSVQMTDKKRSSAESDLNITTSTDLALLYPGGGEGLVRDAQKILGNHPFNEQLDKAELEIKKNSSRVIFQLEIDKNGNIEKVQMLQGRKVSPQQQQEWEKSLKKELKKFNLQSPNQAGTLRFPVIVE
jgi:hypothetical protein